MDNKRCFIFGAGDKSRIYHRPEPGDFVIGADGGYELAKENGIEPQLVLGDFDSLGYIPRLQGIDTIVHPVMKDDTDMMLCVHEGISRGFDTFIIYGAMGGRLDHTIANIQVLSYLARMGRVGILVGEKEMVTVVSDSICFDQSYKGIVSVFAHSDRALGVTEKGLLYEIEDFIMENHMVRGVSNEFKGVPSTISLKEGLLTVIWQVQDNDNLPDICNKRI